MAFHTCDEIQAFKEAFDAFDWNKSGTISYKSLQVKDHYDDSDPDDDVDDCDDNDADDDDYNADEK